MMVHLWGVIIQSQDKYLENEFNRVKGKLERAKGKLKQKFAELTDDDLMFGEGKMEEMIGKLQIKLGKSKEEWQKMMAEL